MMIIDSAVHATMNESIVDGYRVYIADEDGMVRKAGDGLKATICCQAGMEIASVKRIPQPSQPRCCSRSRYSVSIKWTLPVVDPKPKLRFLIVPFDMLGFALPMG